MVALMGMGNGNVEQEGGVPELVQIEDERRYPTRTRRPPQWMEDYVVDDEE